MKLDWYGLYGTLQVQSNEMTRSMIHNPEWGEIEVVKEDLDSITFEVHFLGRVQQGTRLLVEEFYEAFGDWVTSISYLARVYDGKVSKVYIKPKTIKEDEHQVKLFHEVLDRIGLLEPAHLTRLLQTLKLGD